MPRFYTAMFLALSLFAPPGAAILSRPSQRADGKQSADIPLLVVSGGLEDGSDETDVVELLAKPNAEFVLYDHMPKAGGSFLEQLVRSAVSDAHFRLRTEFESLTQADIDSTFVIGSVRNPCEYYLSLWSYGAEQEGSTLMMHMPEELKYLYKTASPNKDSRDDVDKFREWVRVLNKPGYPGIMSMRFAQSYGELDMPVNAEAPPFDLPIEELEAVARAIETRAAVDRVDCWVTTEDLVEDAGACLHAWHAQTGIEVHWHDFERMLSEAGTNPTSHGACRDFFDTRTEALVREHEAKLFDFFGYETCCV